MTPVPEAANPLTRNVSTLAQRAPDSRSSCARRRRNDASVAARDALCPATPAKQRRSLSVGGVSDACSAAPAICRSPAARPRTPTLSAYPPTNPHRTIQRCAQLTVGKGGGAEHALGRSTAECDPGGGSASVESVCDACSAPPAVQCTLTKLPTHARLPQAAAGERLPQAASCGGRNSCAPSHPFPRAAYRMWWPSTRQSSYASTVQRERARPAATPASGASSHARVQPHA